MTTPPAVLLAELIMSIDRMIRTAESATPIPGEWAPQVVLGHISQVDEQVWIPRIEQMCQAQTDGQSPPEFTWWEPDATKTQAKFQAQPLQDVAAIAMATRTTLVTAIKDLSAEQWNATAKHETFGKIDVSALIIQILTHDEDHRASLV
ncbi:unannotated protein [freshwater metagenome]|uniref:Unannotated protein n=1 Tax=freshwater metagenome TaxID=449393 RepID=A0A6J7Q3K1_9ZZZZ|nr:hypothetical protein [Actinomycetota bacterium]MSW24490.1 hypothetical protein [Actinomycetota bacterium]MSX29624.1 hypothetical protein [Actinomycetota bacterium]MSX97803.1 hypothetical protein [Actinomycetota bacterium]MSY53417.1 hypothetical protein [Actinomycetota bacterium]